MSSALAEYQVVGVANNVSFLDRVVTSNSFTTAKLDTSLIEREKDWIWPKHTTIPAIAVVLAALIDKGGNVQSLQVVSGPPLLVRAAIDAVKQWRYQPLLVNGQPIEVETTVTVNFHVRSE